MPLPSQRRRHSVVALGAALALSLAAFAAPAQAAPDKPAPTKTEAKKSSVVNPSDVRELSPDRKLSTKKLKLDSSKKRKSVKAAEATPPVGTVRTMLASDDYEGGYYRKEYTLRGVGDHLEVWVANDTAFPKGDCRDQIPNSTTVTDAQVKGLIDQFDDNMYPKESAAFSVAPDRDGSKAIDEAYDYSGDGDKTVTLVDNVRDDNYYEGVQAAPTYIAGFFSSALNELMDRNVMTIDAYDWAHRTGANPPDQPTSDPCTSRGARPRLYEGTFAHEYQHLLQYYTDPLEVNWVNEGLSDYAQSLVGYVDTRLGVGDKGGDSHIYCYQGFGTTWTAYNTNPRDCGGPANSLTVWGDQGSGSDILADYGEAYSFMQYLKDHYGADLLSTLHRDGAAQGLAGLQDALNKEKGKPKAYNVLHDFQVSTLIDKYVDRSSGKVYPSGKSRYVSKSLNSTANLSNPDAYAALGASPNGADYLGLRAANGLYLDGSKLKSLSFSGAKTLAPEPLAWTVATDPPEHEGDAAIFSGNESNTDATAIFSATVPTADPTLTFEHSLLAEEGYDYAYVVISTDGGSTYTSLANSDSVDGPYGKAFNGHSDGFVSASFDLSAYAGKSVLLGFRYVSDGGVNDGGWWVDDVKVGSTLISDGSSLAPFKSRTQIKAIPVAGFNVRIIGLDTAKHKARVHSFTSRNHSVSAKTLKKLRTYPRVVVLVSYDEPTEEFAAPALYWLKANGVVQPGGGLAEGVTPKADTF